MQADAKGKAQAQATGMGQERAEPTLDGSFEPALASKEGLILGGSRTTDWTLKWAID
jgi:hypothetical protein